MRKVRYSTFLLTAIFVLALLMFPFATVLVSADNADAHVTATTNASVKQGEDGICNVYIDSLERLSSLIVTVHYDQSKVHVAEGSVENAAPSLLYDKKVNDDNVQFSYIFDGNGDATETELFYFEYTVLESAKIGDAYFDIVVSEAYDSNLDAISVVGSRCGFSILTNSSLVTHNYTRQVINDAYIKFQATCTEPAVYYYCCDTCDAKGENTFEYGDKLGHTGGTATCTAQAECSRCHQLYGEVREHVYTDENVENIYLKSEATCTSKAIYYKNCATCSRAGEDTFEHGTVLGHIGGTASCTTQAKCTRCDQLYGNTLDHVYTDEDVAVEYLKSDATCTGKAVYYKNCVTCDKVGLDTFEFGEKKEHTYVNDCDTDCNVCGYTRTVNHNYDNEWLKNEEKHWYECLICGNKKNEAAHTPGADATENTQQVCVDCGYVIKEALGHTHSYDITKNDEMNHWNECACGDRTSTALHAWNDGVVTKEATYDEEGEKTFTCVVCNATKLESIEKLIRPVETTTGAEDTEDTGETNYSDIVIDQDDETETDMIESDEPSVNFDGRIFAVIAIGAVAVIIIVAIFFVHLKKRADS